MLLWREKENNDYLRGWVCLESPLPKKYVKEGHVVIAIDNFMSGSLNNVRDLLNHKNFKLVVGDITNLDLMEKRMSGVDAVIHLAAQIHVDRSIIEPKLT